MPREIYDTLIEKLVLSDGRSYLLYRPRVRYSIDGRCASGYLCEPDGKITNAQQILDYRNVVHHVRMGRVEGTLDMVEMPEWPVTLS